MCLDGRAAREGVEDVPLLVEGLVRVRVRVRVRARARARTRVRVRVGARVRVLVRARVRIRVSSADQVHDGVGDVEEGRPG